MSSRSPSPPSPRRDLQRMAELAELFLRAPRRRRRRRPRPRPRPRHGPYSPNQRAASIPTSPSPVHVSPDRCPPSPVPRSTGLHTPPEPQHQEQSGSELNITPCIAIINAPENQDPGSPTSPPGSPPSVDVNSAGVSRDRCSMAPALWNATVGASDFHTQRHPQDQEESGSELDSPPRITFIPREEDQEPSTPTSPPGSPMSIPGSPTSSPGSPPSIDMKLAGSPEYSSYDEEDPYFTSLVDNFVTAAADVCNSTLSDDDIDYEAADQRHSVLYAESALKHYNNNENNKIKYELIRGITSCDMLVREGCFGHVNFTAKGDQEDSKEELFFAELHWDRDTPVPTCVLSLEGIKKVGGLCGSRYDKFCLEGLPIDSQHCYSCDRRIKHPKDGTLYKMGHVACSMFYHG